MSRIALYWKAVIGFIVPGAVIIGSAVTDSSVGGQTITLSEWVTAIVACIVTAGGVYAVPNAVPGVGADGVPDEPRHAAD